MGKRGKNYFLLIIVLLGLTGIGYIATQTNVLQTFFPGFDILPESQSESYSITNKLCGLPGSPYTAISNEVSDAADSICRPTRSGVLWNSPIADSERCFDKNNNGNWLEGDQEKLFNLNTGKDIGIADVTVDISHTPSHIEFCKISSGVVGVSEPVYDIAQERLVDIKVYCIAGGKDVLVDTFSHRDGKLNKQYRDLPNDCYFLKIRVDELRAFEGSAQEINVDFDVKIAPKTYQVSLGSANIDSPKTINCPNAYDFCTWETVNCQRIRDVTASRSFSCIIEPCESVFTPQDQTLDCEIPVEGKTPSVLMFGHSYDPICETNDCNSGEILCSPDGTSNYRECDVDNDGCLVWDNEIKSIPGKICQDGKFDCAFSECPMPSFGCENNQEWVCVEDEGSPGCNLKSYTSCSGNEQCIDGSCACVDETTRGTTECRFGDVYTYNSPGVGQCAEWIATDCGLGKDCSIINGRAQCICTNYDSDGKPPCSPGADRCGADGNEQQCIADNNGCYDWQTTTICAQGQQCNPNFGNRCDCPDVNECQTGDQQCLVQTADQTDYVECVTQSSGVCNTNYWDYANLKYTDDNKICKQIGNRITQECDPDAIGYCVIGSDDRCNPDGSGAIQRCQSVDSCGQWVNSNIFCSGNLVCVQQSPAQCVVPYTGTLSSSEEYGVGDGIGGITMTIQSALQDGEIRRPINLALADGEDRLWTYSYVDENNIATFPPFPPVFTSKTMLLEAYINYGENPYLITTKTINIKPKLKVSIAGLATTLFKGQQATVEIRVTDFETGNILIFDRPFVSVVIGETVVPVTIVGKEVSFTPPVTGNYRMTVVVEKSGFISGSDEAFGEVEIAGTDLDFTLDGKTLAQIEEGKISPGDHELCWAITKLNEPVTAQFDVVIVTPSTDEDDISGKLFRGGDGKYCTTYNFIEVGKTYVIKSVVIPFEIGSEPIDKEYVFSTIEDVNPPIFNFVLYGIAGFLTILIVAIVLVVLRRRK